MRTAFLITSILLLLGLESCFTFQSPRDTEAIQHLKSEIWVRYIPETDHDAQFRLGVRPIPMDNGWTDLRIERDLKRIVFCGIDVVIVETAPQKLMDNEFLERFRQFGRKAAENKIKVVLSLVEDEGIRLERANLLQYLESLELHCIPSYLLKDKIPVVLVDSAFNLSDAQQDEPLALLRFGKELPARPDTPLVDEISLPAEFIWCRSAQCTPQGEWLIKRKRGGNLQKQLDLLRQTQCKVILLSSWNDYARGDFIESNSLDGEGMMRILNNR